MESSGSIATSDHLGPQVNIAVWICFIISGLAATAKLLTKLGRSHRDFRFSSLELDDYLITASIVFAAGQSITVSQQVEAGLGDHFTTLTSSQIARYEKAGFAAEFLYILALATAKIAALLFALNLSPHSKNKAVINGLIAFVGAWALVSVFGIAFQCKVPRTWTPTSEKCFNQPAFWAFVEAVNGLTDVALVTILCTIVWILQITKAKFMLLSVFAARSLSTPGSPEWDPTSKETSVAIATAVLMNASIVVSCVPFLKPLMEHLQPGWSTSDVIRGVGYNVMYGKSQFESGAYPMGSVVSGQSRSNASGNRSQIRTQSLTSLNPTGTAAYAERTASPMGGLPLKGSVIQRTDVFHVESRHGSEANG
ncbi:uncharacterized protein BDR25DRAFT_346264 [Lindgomyces ingoldianus]|uniref:Uncharacterized protein n=1 Tax=Lindgomyces ingoldianus TaxID=673940 RepID=A0ACB6QG77_9PLEO|nr:uncharacterized protein BDR25DRAFT_346264 [Lindgomyces ingoldianus]KAF2465155.1 hypothetical protein BDR25DRAFT_346264 [Lindgomyces ingoldianus]